MWPVGSFRTKSSPSAVRALDTPCESRQHQRWCCLHASWLLYAVDALHKLSETILWELFARKLMTGHEDTLKVEYHATTLSLYSIRLSADRASITEVKNARRLETHFRSPQLSLWHLSETEWLLALRRPEPAVRRNRGKIVALARQLPLPDWSVTG
jgi:hypothetical protein